MVEAAVPTALFTVCWLGLGSMRWALIVSVLSAAVLLVARLVQRSTVQFCVNALIGIGIGWLFANYAARGGGTEQDQALAYFLPGILYNAGYAALMSFTCLIRWPLVGFMVGSVTGDPTGWRRDRQVTSLCTRLTWILAAPCLVRVAIQGPLWLAGTSASIDPDTVVALLGTLKIILGWPLQILTLTVMAWTLGRNHTPLT